MTTSDSKKAISSKKVAKKKVSTKKVTKKTVAKKAAPKKTVAKKAAPKKTVAKKVSPKKTVAKTAVKTAAPSKQKKTRISNDEKRMMIAVHAYYKWQKAGYPTGDGFNHWLEAENEIDDMIK